MVINNSPMSSNLVEYSFTTETQVKLEAFPSPGYRFFRWGGYTVSSENPIIVNIDCNKTILAIFEPLTPVLTIEKYGQGSVSSSPGEYSFRQGTKITITGTPANGWKFDGWSDNVDDPNLAVTTLTLDSDTKIIARFSRILSSWVVLGVIISDVAIMGAIGWVLFRRTIEINFNKILKNNWTSFLSRFVLGGVLLFAGLAKIYNINELILEMKQYRILPNMLASIYGYLLPNFEIIIGILLLLGLFRKVSAIVAGLMVLSFTIAKIVAIISGLNIDICSCFGPVMPLLSAQSLAIDIILLAIMAQIIFYGNEYLSIEKWFRSIPKSIFGK